jgi:hypothetical protein
MRLKLVSHDQTISPQHFIIHTNLLPQPLTNYQSLPFQILYLLLAMISHLVDPDGDIDLLLLEDAALRLDCEFELHPLASKLDYGRPTTPILTNSKKKKKKGSKDESVYTQEPEPVNVIKLLSLGENNDKNRSQELESIGHGGECVASEADDALVRIRVSSKHLILASSYFKRSLQSGLAESCALQAHGHVEVNMKEHDPEAMLIVMNSIHGRNRRIPSSVDVNMLTKIAVLVDYIQSHETIEPFSDRWIEKMEEKIPKIYCRELVHWLCISYVFDKASIFKTVTHTALCQATGPVAEIGVPIWDYVSGEIFRSLQGNNSTNIREQINSINKGLPRLNTFFPALKLCWTVSDSIKMNAHLIATLCNMENWLKSLGIEGYFSLDLRHHFSVTASIILCQAFAIYRIRRVAIDAQFLHVIQVPAILCLELKSSSNILRILWNRRVRKSYLCR